MRTPINFVVATIAVGAACVVVGSVLVALAIGRFVRRKRWPAEWERRRAQTTVLAHVDDCTPITDQHVRLTLTIEERITDGCREPRERDAYLQLGPKRWEIS